MPIYLYQNPKTKMVIEISQSIHDSHEYKDQDGLIWERVFTVPQLNTNGTLSADIDSKKFVEKTSNKKGTYGDLWDQSKELSEKRIKKYGYDPIKKKYKKDWSNKRKGKKFLE